MENTSAINIATLAGTYRYAEQPASGLSILQQLLPVESQPLKNLLRHHKEGNVYKEELQQRFEIDSLFQFYALLEVAIIAGYVDAGLNEAFKAEIVPILDDQWVKRYYEMNYPYKLLTILRYTLKMDVRYEASNVPLSRKVFNNFLLANRSIEHDDDVDIFLKMLDAVSFGDEGLASLMQLLKNKPRLSRVLFKPDNESYTERSLWGFIKYTDFLFRLKHVIDLAGGVPLLQSAVWEYHSYWFRIMAEEMRHFFDKAFSNIVEVVNDTPLSDIYEKMDSESPVNEFENHKKEILSSVHNAQEACNYLLNNNLSTALDVYLGQLVTRLGLDEGIQVMGPLNLKK